MLTRWRTLELLEPKTEASAEIALISREPLLCRGSEAHRRRILNAAERNDFVPELAQTLDVLSLDDHSPRILVLGIGAARNSSEAHWLSIGGFVVEAMTQHRIPTLRIPASAVLGGPEVIQTLLLGAFLHGFRLENHAALEKKGRFTPKGVTVAEEDFERAQNARRLANSINRARAWVEQPPNLLTPVVWAEEVREIFGQHHARVITLGPKELRTLGAGALLAVGRGSEHGAQLLVVEWRGDAARDQWDAVMVGKGLTFDAGGLNLKSQPNIAKMKFDMAGGAGVLGALELAITRQSRANVVAIVPMVENLIDAMSYRPSDVITSLSGLTIEVADTDAEGRLTLADGITYGIRTYEPSWLIDAATLTGTVTGVLHEEFAALYCSDTQLADDLVEAGEAVAERLWRMPLDPSQDYLVESQVADVSNIGVPGFLGRGTGSPTAGAKFLEKFAAGTRWAHIDIAGTAWSTRRTVRCGRGATGYGVRLLDRWLVGIEGRINEQKTLE